MCSKFHLRFFYLHRFNEAKSSQKNFDYILISEKSTEPNLPSSSKCQMAWQPDERMKLDNSKFLLEWNWARVFISQSKKKKKIKKKTEFYRNWNWTKVWNSFRSILFPLIWLFFNLFVECAHCFLCSLRIFHPFSIMISSYGADNTLHCVTRMVPASIAVM